jgi:hypothetical protein
MDVTRRIGAMIGIVVILILVAGLVWSVYLHHERAGRVDDESTMVSVDEKFSNTSVQVIDFKCDRLVARLLLLRGQETQITS